MFEITQKIEEQLPAILVTDIVPLPGSEIRVDINRNEDVKALKSAEYYRNHVVVLLPIKDDKKSPSIDTYHVRAMVAKIVLNMTNPNGSRRVKLQNLVRCDILEFVLTTPHLQVKFTTMPSINSSLDEETATLNLIKQELVSNNKMMPVLENKDVILAALKKGLSSTEFSDLVAFNLSINYETRMKYLLEIDTTKRLKFILEDLQKQKYCSG